MLPIMLMFLGILLCAAQLRAQTDSERLAQVEALVEQGNVDAAIQLYTEMLGEDESDPELLYKRGLLYFQQEKYQESLEDMDKVVQSDRKNSNAFLYRGVSRIQIAKVRLGTRDLEKAVELNEKNGTAWYYLCQVYLSTKEYDEALDAGLAAVETDALNVECQRCLGTAYYYLSDMMKLLRRTTKF